MKRMLGRGRERQEQMEEEPYYPEPGKDLVLGLPALLGVFFSIAMICAVCFGIGYSSGHGFHFSAQPALATAPIPHITAPVPLPETNAAASKPSEEDSEQNAWPPSSTPAVEAPTPSRFASKPVPGIDVPLSRTPAPLTGDDQPPLPSMRKGNAVPRQPPSAENQQAIAPVTVAREASGVSSLVPRQMAMTPSGIKTPKGAAAATAPAMQRASEGEASNTETTLMVQIAAVNHAVDAQTLATALRHDGFAAIVRTGLNDPLFHVQVGPFPSLQAANAMRERLASNGYNAFIKP